MIGQTQKLKPKEGFDDFKVKGINLDKVLYKPINKEGFPIKNTKNKITT